MDHLISDNQHDVTDKQQVENVEKVTIEQVESKSPSTTVSSEVNETVAATTAIDTIHVSEAVDETSTTSSATSTPPRAQFQRSGHIKSDSTSPRRMNLNPNYPVLVYQYPVSQQQSHSEDVRSKGNK